MHIIIIPLGFILWYQAYKAKPIINKEVNDLWEKENVVKRSRLINILNGGF